MKKIVEITSVILFVLLVLCSCVTTTTTFILSPGEYSEEDASYALGTMLNQAVESANTRFVQRLETYSFIPEYYQILEENQEQIPGMKKLIAQWNNYVSSYISERFVSIENITAQCATLLEFKNAKEMIVSSNISASILLEKEYGDSFKDVLKDILADVDYSLLSNAINQYNAWIEAENYINKTNIQKISTVDVSQDILEITYNNYKDMVATFEELFRTTPSPYSDEICKNVFGIK